MSGQYRTAVALLVLGCLASCATPTEDTTPAQGNSLVSGRQLPAGDLTEFARFDVGIEAGAVADPAGPSEFIVRVRANLATRRVAVRIVAPELDILEATGTLTSAKGVVPTRARLEAREAFGAGEERTYRVALRVPMGQAIRLAASVIQESEEPKVLPDGMPIQSHGYSERLVVRTAAGARMTDPGAERRTERRPTVSGVAAQPPSDVAGNLCATWTVLYNNQDANGGAGALEPIPGIGVYYPNESWPDLPPSPSTVMTDANGQFTLCSSTNPTILLRLLGGDQLYSYMINVVDTLFVGPLGTGGTIIAPSSNHARVYVNLHAIIPETRQFVGHIPPHVTTYVLPGNGTSYYDGSSTIRIYANAVWDDYGIVTAAHEYGHRVQDADLGGIPSVNCPSPHSLNVASNIGCAYTEGFADFFALFMQRSRLSTGYLSDNSLEQNFYYPGGDGAKVEGAVAAFMYDLIDDAADPDGIAGDDDPIQYPYSYLKQIIRTCGYKNPGQANFAAENGIDHATYCLERQIDPAVTGSPVYFVTRATDPIAYQESATEPAGWSAAAIRALWLENLYGQ